MTTNTQSVKAQVSITEKGEIYIGIEARNALDLQYNDGVRVTVMSVDEPETFNGYLNAANMVSTGGSAKHVRSEDTDGVEHADAYVEPASLTWDDVNGFTENRFDDSFTLPSK